MIAKNKALHQPSVAPWHAGFLAMLSAIERRASLAFRGRDSESREDLIEEVVVNAMLAYRRLFEKGKTQVAHPGVLARYAIAQVCEGRKGGSQQNSREVLSDYAQRERGFHVVRLDRYDDEQEAWREILVEDRRTGPAEIAATRIDFAHWLATLSIRERQIAQTLAQGETTNQTAKRFHVTPSRVSRLRREFFRSWREFQGEPTEPQHLPGDLLGATA